MAKHRASRRARSGLIVAIAAAGAALMAASVALVAFNTATTVPAGANPTIVTDHQGRPAPAAQVVARVLPAPGAVDVPSDTLVRVQFTQPVAAGSPMPRLNPPVAGSWSDAGDGMVVFTPTAPFTPGQTMTLTVPRGVAAVDGQVLARGLSTRFTVAPGSILRLQQMLAQMGYLPLAFTPSDGAPTTGREMAAPQIGNFTWRWANTPASLMALWSPGTVDTITSAAVMQFETQHGLTVDGQAGPQVWAAVLAAYAAHQRDPWSYDYVSVQRIPEPETVAVYVNGAVVFTTLANTGIAAAPTESGTWPVYVRYTETTMTGTNPDGSHYSDPGIMWVSYFHGGDALHEFPRSTYGWPQSLGCVEMPMASAQTVYPLTPIGTLVTVQ